MKALKAWAEMANQVQVSELRGVKGFWEKTIATLIENGINTIDQFKWIDEQEAYKFLTPVQYHQINLFIKENNI